MRDVPIRPHNELVRQGARTQPAAGFLLMYITRGGGSSSLLWTEIVQVIIKGRGVLPFPHVTPLDSLQ